MPGPHLSLWPAERADPGVPWRDDVEDLMAHHLEDMLRVDRQLGYKVGNDTDGGGIANGHVRALSNPTLHVQVAAIKNGDINGTKINTARQTSIACASISGLTAGQRRLDVLTVDNTGTFAWTTGSATTGTPALPSFPANQIPLAAVYHRKDSTQVLDYDDGTNSYIIDLRPVLTYPTLPPHTIEDEGTPLTQRSTLNFVGSGVTAADSGGKTVVTISGAPTGSAGGDLAGTYPNPTVAQASGAFALTGILTPSQITANQDNYAPTGHGTASVFRLSSDASRDITGLAGGATGRLVVVQNVGSNNIVLKDEGSGSTAANRFALTADLTLAPDAVAVLQYDATSQRWRAVGGGGGGGHTIEDEGTPLTQRSNLNFTGTGVSAADSGGKTVVTIDAPVAASSLPGSRVTYATSNIDTTSTSFTDVTSMSITMTTRGGPVLLLFRALVTNTSASQATALDIDRDGTRLANVNDGLWYKFGNTDNEAVIAVIDPSPSAASHTYKVQFRTTNASGTARIYAGANDVVEFAAYELARSTGGILDNVTAKTADYTATTADGVITVAPASGDVTITLYAASGNSGRRLIIKKTDSSHWLVTIDGNASETIDGALTFVLYQQYETVIIECDGSNWHVISWIVPKPPSACSRSTANITTADNTLTDITCDETDHWDTDGVHFTSAANLTGTVSKTASSTTLTGSGTSFTTELSVGQVIKVPGTADEKRVVTAIASNTSLTVNTAFANTASGQTAARVNSAFVATRPGRYLCNVHLRWTGNTTGLRIANILLNGATSVATEARHPVQSGAPSVTDQFLVKELLLSRWDFVEGQGSQTSGGNLDLVQSSPRFPAVSLTWLGAT